MAWLQQNWPALAVMVVIVGFMLRGPIMARIYGVENIGVHQLANRLASATPPLLLDVRTPLEYNDGHLKEAILVPLAEIDRRAPSLREKYPNREVAVICRTGNRSLFGSVSLKKAGFPKVANVVGGMVQWSGQGYPVKR